MTIDAQITLNTITISAPITLGITGPPGPGVATGGTTGQVLTKQSATDFDTDWEDTANPFNQDLNTTDSATFDSAQLTGQTIIDGDSAITADLGDARYSGIALYGARISNSQNNTQTIPSGVNTRLDDIFDVEDYDTNNVMSLANGRFQPDKAGYYNVSAIWIMSHIGAGVQITYLLKNGIIYSILGRGVIVSGQYNGFGGSDTVYLNGGSDYVEIFAFQNSGTDAETVINVGYQRFAATLTGE